MQELVFAFRLSSLSSLDGLVKLSQVRSSSHWDVTQSIRILCTTEGPKYAVKTPEAAVDASRLHVTSLPMSCKIGPKRGTENTSRKSQPSLNKLVMAILDSLLTPCL